MIEWDPRIVMSRLSRTVTQDGVTIKVSITRLEHEAKWSLEVFNSARAESDQMGAALVTTSAAPRGPMEEGDSP
jgi:hypothetical protein